MRFAAFNLFLLITITLNAQETAKKTFEVSELKTDIDFFFSELEKSHPNLYYYYPKDSILQAKKTIEQELYDSMSRDDFAKLIEMNTNRFFDGHTGLKQYFGWMGMWKMKTIPDTAFLFPLKQIRVKQGNLYIEKGKKTYKIQSINGKTADKLVSTMRNLQESGKHDYIKDCTIEEFFPVYYYLLYGSSKQFYLTIEKSGKTTQMPLSGIAKKDVYNDNTDNVPRFKLNIQNDMALLTINTFNGMLFEKFQTFLDSSFRQIRQANVKYLFVDVSENAGGSDENVGLLLDYLYPSDYYFLYGYSCESGGETGGFEWKKNNDIDTPYLGKLFILQSYETFSAGMDFSCAIKTSNRGVVIGEMTGDPAYSFSNITETKIMPNTEMNFACASGFYAMPSGSHNVNVGILPDVYCHHRDLSTMKQNTKSMFKYFKSVIVKYGDRENTIEMLRKFE
jgi:hypothetical protein